MEVRVRERLVGALVLVAIVVVAVPAILEGRGTQQSEPAAPLPTRRVEVPIGDATPPPEEQVLVPEPELPGASAPIAEALEPAPPPSKAAADEPRAPKPPVAAPRDRRPQLSVAREPAAPRASSPATAWAVQLGAFSNRAKAERLVAELKKLRYAAFILEYRASGQVLYRVRVGPEQDRARAQETAGRLAKDGYEPVVARHP